MRCGDTNGTGQKPAAGSGLGQTRPVLLYDKEKWQQMRKNNATARTTDRAACLGSEREWRGGSGVALQWQKYRLTCRKRKRMRVGERESASETDRHTTIETMQRPQHEGTRTIAMRQLIFYA